MEYSKEQAFVDTVQAKSHQLYRIAMSLLHSSQDAEDAVSDAIEATWKNLWRIRNTRQLKPGAHFLLHVLCYLKH
jgi:DNA-directed RNA polymerase specialized sigma24 family protein